MILFLFACRPDPGNPDYANFGGLVDADTAFVDDYIAPDPYEEGESRLSIGIFYEGDYSEIIEINDTDTHFYIWNETMLVTSSDERVEGLVSDEILVSNLGWYGGGVYWDFPRDLSTWTHLNLSLQSFSPEMISLEIGLGESDSGQQAWVLASDHGFVTDGNWYTLSIPIQDNFGTLDLTAAQMPLSLRGEETPEGNILRIDNLYFTQESE
jgi:hypothetical protein